jgi:2-isopropylmalate synthase
MLVLSEQRGTNELLSEATVKITVNGVTMHTAAEGNGPVNALDVALRKALVTFYPQIDSVRLTDYKVRVLSEEGTASGIRVTISSSDGRDIWQTVGSSTNVIEASWIALADSLEYALVRDQFKVTPPEPALQTV